MRRRNEHWPVPPCTMSLSEFNFYCAVFRSLRGKRGLTDSLMARTIVSISRRHRPMEGESHATARKKRAQQEDAPEEAR